MIGCADKKQANWQRSMIGRLSSSSFSSRRCTVSKSIRTALPFWIGRLYLLMSPCLIPRERCLVRTSCVLFEQIWGRKCCIHKVEMRDGEARWNWWVWWGRGRVCTLLHREMALNPWQSLVGCRVTKNRMIVCLDIAVKLLETVKSVSHKTLLVYLRARVIKPRCIQYSWEGLAGYKYRTSKYQAPYDKGSTVTKKCLEITTKFFIEPTKSS